MAQEQFTLVPRNVELVKEALKKQYGDLQPAKSVNMSGMYLFPDNSRIDVYKTGNVVFVNRHEDYCKFRTLDMKQDNVHVEEADKSTPILSCLNFEHAVVGSDETGKGEVFKPFIITAAYVKDEEDLLKYLKMGVTDSKKIKGKIATIGKMVTGISRWEEIMDAPLIANDLFVTKIVTNEEYNRRCRERNGDDEGVQKELLTEAHLQVLRELHKRHPESMVVVDDYIHSKDIEVFKNTLSTGADAVPREKIFFTTKGDWKVMAVGLASNISYYFSTLGMEYVQKQLNQIYKRNNISEVKMFNGSEKSEVVEEFLAQLKPELKDEFMDKYAKCYFDNVKAVMNL